MPFQMPYTTDSGIGLEESYWVLSEVSISPVRKSGYIAFTAYKDEAAFEATPRAASIGGKTYSITPETYDGFLQALNLDATVYAPAYQMAKLVADTLVDGQLVSFFADATEV